MPVHDWTRVSDGTFHDLHVCWIAEIRTTLNDGLMPPDYYVQVEKVIRPMGPVRAEADIEDYVLKRCRLTIRHNSDHRIVALIEILSPGNKSSRDAIESFVEKAVEALKRGYHLLLIDLFPPGPRDPQGIDGLIWDEIGPEPFTLPEEQSLTFAAYSAGQPKRAYVNTIASGDGIPGMPLFLEPDLYVNVPLEQTYMRVYRGVPRRYRDVLEAK